MNKIVNYIIIVEILINIAMRQISWDVQNYGNTVCLAILSFVAYLISKGNDKIISLFAMIIFLTQILDIAVFNQFAFQWNDVTFIAIAAVSSIVIAKKHYLKGPATLGAVVLILILLIYWATTSMADDRGKLISVFAFGMRRSYFEVGNTFIHALLALYIYNRYNKESWFYPVGVLLIGLTINDLQDNLRGDPYTLNPEEPYILGFFIITAIIGWAVNNYQKTVKRAL